MQQSKLAKNKMMAQTSYISQFKIKALRIVNLIQSCVPK